MKKIFMDQLFNHNFLVCEEKTASDIAFASRFILDKSFGIRIISGKDLVTKEMIPYVAEQLGERVPEPFYRGFPESVRSLSSDQLLFDQLLHYERTYGKGNFDEQGHSVVEEYFERQAFNEKTDIRNFDILPEADAVFKLAEYVDALTAGTRPLSDDQYDFVCEYIHEYEYIPQNCASKNLAIRLLLDFRNKYYATFINMSDVIKLVDEMNYRDYGNEDISNLNLKNRDRKFITAVINQLFHSDSCDIRNCFEKKSLWAGLLHHIHYKPFDNCSAQFVQCMRGKGNYSVFSEFEQALKEADIHAAVNALKSGKGSGAILRNLNYIISRCNTDEDIDYVVSQIDASNGIVLLQLLMKYSFYDANQSARIFKFSRHNKLVVHEETHEEFSRRKSMISSKLAAKLAEAIKANLQKAYAGKLGKVYIDPAMSGITLPLQENTSSSGFGVLPKGSRIHIEEGKKVRAFTYWEKVNDIDLSVIGMCADGRQMEFSWRSMWGRQSDAITYSGDETSGYYGGSEYFDIDVAKFKAEYPEIKYLVFCDNVYSHANFSDCVCRAGYMLRDVVDSGEVYEPKTVKSSFTVDCESTFAYLFAIELATNDFIWLNVSRDSNTHIAGTTSLKFLTDYFKTTDVMNMYTFFSMLASEIVTDMKDADVIVSDENINIEEKDIIRSYDFEKIISLMNN